MPAKSDIRSLSARCCRPRLRATGRILSIAGSCTVRMKRLAALDSSARGYADSTVVRIQTCWRFLDEVGSPATILALPVDDIFGFVTGGALPVTVASNWLSTVWDQNVSMHEITPATSMLEHMAMTWMIELFGLPDKCRCGISSLAQLWPISPRWQPPDTRYSETLAGTWSRMG